MSQPPAMPASAKALFIAAEVRRRIVGREWRQGDRIPDEAALAVTFGVARATVNKALQLLAEEGLLERRRRAGTRVAVDPARKAVLTVPIVREQIEAAGFPYGHRIIASRRSPLPASIARRMGLTAGLTALHLREVHYAGNRPWQLEDRWINPHAVPEIEAVDFRQLNSNEWLVRNAPYVRATMDVSAANADRREARLLDIRQGQALLIVNRTTFNDIGPITSVRLAFQPGHVMVAD
ncbi:GntR family transcriptional regulator [Paenirhodobacter populi]|uniref:GntR family transcriptional regulator n=1 Tax=Paenirhodobacter populi TaxID=2306993 RepID=UPI001F4F3CFE|nr:GntR family transcriptional regulator [Sinirhodobacter populi]